MARVHAEGGLERGVLLDTWKISRARGAPRSSDGNHRHSHFQTVVWELLEVAMRSWTSLALSDSGVGAA